MVSLKNVASVVLFLTFTFSSFADKPLQHEYNSDEILVRFAPKHGGFQRNANEKAQILKSANCGVVKHSYRIVPGLTHVKLPRGLSVEKALKRLNKRKDVISARPDYKIYLLSTFPNDPLFSNSWGLHNTGQIIYSPRVPAGEIGYENADIDAPEAWDIHTDASNIVVAVLDSGIDYNHPDLASNMWVNQAELNGDPNSDDDGNDYNDDVYGYDFADGDSDPNDYNLHGTHVAGIIGAVGNNNLGVTGVCWNVKIMSVKIFPNYGEATFISRAIEGIEYAIDNGATVLNNSWGGGPYDSDLYDAIKAAEAEGVLFIAAAGNSGDNNDSTPFYPTSYDVDNIISVMATDQKDVRSIWPEYNSSSCYGQTSVDLAAPGSNILSTFPTYETGVMAFNSFSTDYEIIDGTSMATPHVSGACALVWSMYPHLSMLEVKQIILDSADELNSLQGLCVTGARLNLYQALLHAHPLVIDIEDDVDDPTGCVEPYDEITFTISYSNPSTTNTNDPNYFGSAEDVEIQFPLPIELDCTNISDPNFSIFTRTFVWDIGTLEPQESGTITVTITVNQNAEPLGIINSKVKIISSVGYGEATEETRVCCWGGNIIYVDAFADGQAETGVGWDNAYKTLQKALGRARKLCGDEIWVASGVYTPTEGSDPSISFDMIEGVNLYGGFDGTEDSVNDRNFIVNRTYLSGNVDVGGDDDSYIVVNTEPNSVISSSTVLDGFIVTHSTEAGIYCNEADLTIQNCVVTDNAANGIYIYNSEPYVLDSIITDNASVGIYDCNETDTWIEGCIISENGGNGISCRKNGKLSLLNSWVYGNSDGISFDDGATGSLIRNSTIVDNLRNGIAVVQGSTPAIKNSIIWNNSQGDLSGCSATYSCFDDGYQGTGNTDNDPNFAYKDTAAHNYHLHTGSPCIDTGDSNSYTNEYDIDGEIRVFGSLVDMGADEVYSCDASLSLDDVFNNMDFNSDGALNYHEFSTFASAWLSHDSDDPSLPTDPNDPEYISEPNVFGNYDATQDFNSDYVIDFSDLDHFAGVWPWIACWFQADTWISTFGNVDGDTDEMLNEQTAGTAFFAAGGAAMHIDATPIEEQLIDTQEVVGTLEDIWLDDPDIQNHIMQEEWDNFMKQLYGWLNILESQYMVEQVNSE